MVLAVVPSPDLNGGFSVATPSRLRCGLTRCEALHSITHVYSGSSAFKLEAEGNHHTRQLQPPPIIDDDLTAAITDTESGHLRAARLTQCDCVRAGNQTVKTYTFIKILSVSDESSYIPERHRIFGSSCIFDLNLLDQGFLKFC